MCQNKQNGATSWMLFFEIQKFAFFEFLNHNHRFTDSEIRKRLSEHSRFFSTFIPKAKIEYLHTFLKIVESDKESKISMIIYKDIGPLFSFVTDQFLKYLTLFYMAWVFLSVSTF